MFTGPRFVGRGLTRFGEFSAHPFAFAIVLIYAVLWLIFERDTFDWHGVATLATWLMTLVITRSEYRDTQAIHAKLDELLRTSGAARSDLVGLDEQEPEEVADHRKEEARLLKVSKEGPR